MRQVQLLIDADPICYRAASSAETEMEFTQDVTVVVGDFRRGKDIVRQEIRDLMQRFDTKLGTLYFTGESNFRKDVDPTYKGNRIKRKPAGYKKLKNWCLHTYKSRIEDVLEADDLLGIEATSGMYAPFVVVSPDKDLKQIPGRHYNGKTEFDVTPEEGEKFFWIQTLCGDPTDGYKGVPGIGEKRAKALLDAVEDGNYWEAVLQAFLDADLTEEDALRTCRLAKILTSKYWDSDRGYTLWSPDS